MKPLPGFTVSIVLTVSCLAQSPAKPAPDRLVALRTNHERAIERITEPVKLQYRDALVKLKLEYTKAGNLEAALAVEEEIKARFPGWAPASTAAARPPASTASARVNVKNSVIARLVKGEKLFTESEYIWVAIPDQFAGMQFAQPKNKHTATTVFEVETAGLVYVAFASRWNEEDDNKKDDILARKDIQRLGWKPLPGKTHLVSDENGYEWIVCTKECKGGETFSLRTDKYCAPIVLLR